MMVGLKAQFLQYWRPSVGVVEGTMKLSGIPWNNTLPVQLQTSKKSSSALDVVSESVDNVHCATSGFY